MALDSGGSGQSLRAATRRSPSIKRGGAVAHHKAVYLLGRLVRVDEVLLQVGQRDELMEVGGKRGGGGRSLDLVRRIFLNWRVSRRDGSALPPRRTAKMVMPVIEMTRMKARNQ